MNDGGYMRLSSSSSGNAAVLAKGELLTWLLASLSLPGWFTFQNVDHVLTILIKVGSFISVVFAIYLQYKLKHKKVQ
jgi:hypothetical protein